jgi:hypothetical protein
MFDFIAERLVTVSVLLGGVHFDFALLENIHSEIEEEGPKSVVRLAVCLEELVIATQMYDLG